MQGLGVLEGVGCEMLSFAGCAALYGRVQIEDKLWCSVHYAQGGGSDRG